MRAYVVINHLVAANEAKQNPIRIIDAVRPISLQFSVKFMGSQSRIKRVTPKPLIFLLSRLLNLAGKLAVGLGKGGRNMNSCDRASHLLTKLGKRPCRSCLAVLEFSLALPYHAQSILNFRQALLHRLKLMPRNHHQLNPMRKLLGNHQRMLHSFPPSREKYTIHRSRCHTHDAL